MFHGDSTMAPYLTAYPSGNTGAYKNGAVRRMRDALIAAGHYAQDEFFQGTMGYTTAASFASFDTRMTLGAGWDFAAISAVNYGILQNSTTVNPWVFGPDTQCDTATVWFRSVTGTGSVSVAFGGITKTVDLQRPTPQFVSVTIGPSDGVVLGNNVVSVARVSGTIALCAEWARNSRLPAYQLLNASSSGAKAQHAVNSQDNGRPLYFPEQVLTAGDICIWQIGINDWKMGQLSDLATFKGMFEQWADRRIAHGIVPRLVLPVRSNAAGALIEDMDTYYEVMIASAKARNIAYLSMKDRWGEFNDADAAGFMVGGSDYYHPNWYGAQDMGLLHAAWALSV